MSESERFHSLGDSVVGVSLRDFQGGGFAAARPQHIACAQANVGTALGPGASPEHALS